MDQDDDLAKKSNVTGDVTPSTEYFGFAFYVGSFALLIAYAIWAFTPKYWLEKAHIYYYPSRWWAVAIPAFVLTTMLYIYVVLACYNTEVLTFGPETLETLTDLEAKIERDPKYLFQNRDGVRDLPRAAVCEVLYT